MYLCPHCERPGIGFAAKLLSNPVYPAVCRLCGRNSSKCSRVIWLQIGIAVGFLATVPNLVPETTAYTLGTVVAFIIIGIGQVGPLCKYH